jgi:hypothetical protein
MSEAGGLSADERKLHEYAVALADAVDEALPRWIERCVARYVAVEGDVARQVREITAVASAEAAVQMRELLFADIDVQRRNPLAVLRAAVRYPTSLLASLGVPAPDRDAFAERAFPDDRYDLSPASFGDVDPSLHEPGLVWGAAKAHVHLQRRREEGRR